MSANTAPVFPIAPVVGIASLNAASAVTNRVPITGTTGLVQLTATSVNGLRVDAIMITGQGTTVASIVDVWIYNGTTSFLFAEIAISAVTASTSGAAFSVQTNFPNLLLPSTYQLYVSQQVQTNLTIFALGGSY